MKSFDHLARPYALLERCLLGGTLQAARSMHLPKLRSARNVLCLGEGDGRCLERLLESAPDAQVDVVDKSARMLALAKQRVGASERVRWHHLSVHEFATETRYDAVLTLFFLDCFEGATLRTLIQRTAARLGPSGLWLYADFQHQDGRRHRSHRALIRLLYRAFGLITDIEAQRLDDPRPIFTALGMRRLASAELRRGLVRSEVWQAPA